jgi:hypothetical protein
MTTSLSSSSLRRVDYPTPALLAPGSAGVMLSRLPHTLPFSASLSLWVICYAPRVMRARHKLGPVRGGRQYRLHHPSVCATVRLRCPLLLAFLAYDNFPFRRAVIAASRPAHFHLSATPRAVGELESRAHKRSDPRGSTFPFPFVNC